MSADKYLASQEIYSNAKESLDANDFMLMNKIDIEICALLQSKQSNTGFEDLSTEQQICVATFNAEGHIHCGGFMDLFQYFSDEEIKATIEGYQTFGNSDLLKLIEKAIKIFPKSPPLPSHSDREEILDIWFDKDKDPFTKLDKKFMTIGSALRQRLSFIINHPDHFFVN